MKRYHVGIPTVINEHPEGEYVLYSDHVAEIDRVRKATIDECLLELDEYRIIEGFDAGVEDAIAAMK